MAALMRGTVIARGVECPAVWRNGYVRYKSPSGKVLQAGFTVRATFIEKGRDRQFNFTAYPETPIDLGIVRGTVKYRGHTCPAIKLRTGQVFYARPMMHSIRLQAAANGKTYKTFKEYPNREELSVGKEVS